MTTLAIIGAGIAGRSLLYTLKKSKKRFDKILVFYSDSFVSPCSINSTSIVAARGVSAGVSELGDLLQQGYSHFRQHALQDAPQGVTKIIQFTGAYSKLEQFKKRYPAGVMTDEFAGLKLRMPTYIAQEEAFMIDPGTYLDWLLAEAQDLPLEMVNDLVVEVEPGATIKLKTNSQHEYQADQLIFASGAASRFWKQISSDKKWQSSKPVQGTYLEFQSVDLKLDSISLTLEGNNFIYDSSRKRLLIGSTTQEGFSELAPLADLKQIYLELKSQLDILLPGFEEGIIKLGLREKASKREPYLIQENNMSMLGGLYKNGYCLGLSLSRKWLDNC